MDQGRLGRSAFNAISLLDTDDDSDDAAAACAKKASDTVAIVPDDNDNYSYSAPTAAAKRFFQEDFSKSKEPAPQENLKHNDDGGSNTDTREQDHGENPPHIGMQVRKFFDETGFHHTLSLIHI